MSNEKGTSLTIEVRAARCCMCPNRSEFQSTVCPAEPFKKDITACSFVRKYHDRNGALCFVSNDGNGDSDHTWVVVRQKSSGSEVRRISSVLLPIRETFDEMQADLNAYTKKKGWKALLNAENQEVLN